MWGTQPELTAEINRVFRQRHPINLDADFYPQILVRPVSQPRSYNGNERMLGQSSQEGVEAVPWHWSGALTVSHRAWFQVSCCTLVISYPSAQEPVLAVQAAMRLSAEQTRSLREWRARLMVESAAAVRQRVGLLMHLNCQILGDDARSMERVGDVRYHCCEPAFADPNHTWPAFTVGYASTCAP